MAREPAEQSLRGACVQLTSGALSFGTAGTWP